MTTPKRKPKNKSKQTQSTINEVEFSIKPGTKAVFTIEAGEEQAGEIPIRIRVEKSQAQKNVKGDMTQVKVKNEAGSLSNWLQSISQSSFIKKYNLPTWLFFGALFFYLATRLIGLTQFPIYFFTDEAIQTQAMAELISNGYRDINEVFLPPYFRNGEYANLSLSVYLQWIPLLLLENQQL